MLEGFQFRSKKDLVAMGEATPAQRRRVCEDRGRETEGFKMSYRVQEYINLFMYFISSSTVNSEKESSRPI
jgi:hypothetical protein